MAAALTPDLASRFAQIALGNVEREYPHKLDHVTTGPGDVDTPHALHPVFYGSFDWHSCVHGYWLLAGLHRRVPGLPETDAIRRVFDLHFVPGKVAGEVAYLDRPFTATFERPYGWAWVLALAAELMRGATPEAKRWSEALAPLARAFAARFIAILPKSTYPIRSGAHFNSAFAVTMALDYAAIANDAALGDLLRERARLWFGADRNYPGWEPSGEEFISPGLMEAECMHRALPSAEFCDWLARFLPRLGEGQPEQMFKPAMVSDRSDGKIAHLDGLNLSRAWCMRALAGAFPAGDAGAAALRQAAELHLAASLPHVSGDYMGEHWLASFALLALLA
jgi:hypothetical protein